MAEERSFLQPHVHWWVAHALGGCYHVKVGVTYLSRIMENGLPRLGWPTLSVLERVGPLFLHAEESTTHHRYSRAKMQEKLNYMHENPVRGKLVKHPGDWAWSSWCDYYRGAGLLRMDPWG